MRSSYGGPGTSRSTWKPNQDPGKQAPAASTNAPQTGKNDANQTGRNATQKQQQNNTEEKK